MKSWLVRNRKILAYLLVVSMGVLGLWRVESSANAAQEASRKAETASRGAAAAVAAQEAEAKARERALCHATNEARDGIRSAFDDLIIVTRSQPPRPDLTNEEAVVQQERTDALIEAFLKRLDESIPELDCNVPIS